MPINRTLLAELKALSRGEKSAFVPGPGMQPQGQPAGPSGAAQPQAPMPPSPYSDPSAMAAAGAPAGPMPQAPPQAPPGGAEQGAGGGDALSALAPMIDQRVQALLAQQGQGGQAGAAGAGAGGKPKAPKVDPELLHQDVAELKQNAIYTRKLLTALLEQNGKPMPYDILDADGDGVPDNQQGQQAQPQPGAAPQGA